MEGTLQKTLKSIEELLDRVTNPRVACGNRCARTITLQRASWDSSSPIQWTCDAAAECGSGNEHFCRFPPLLVEGAGASPEAAAEECRLMLGERVEQVAREEEFEE